MSEKKEGDGQQSQAANVAQESSIEKLHATDCPIRSTMGECLGSSMDLLQKFEECEHLWDKCAYERFHQTYPRDLENIAEMEDALEYAEIYINALYSYRSISACLPMIDPKLEKDEKNKVYKQLFDLLSPQIRTLNDIMEFHNKIIKVFKRNMRLLASPVEGKKVLWLYHMRLLIRIIDAIYRMDFLKERKSHLKNDFSRYRRTFIFIKGVLPNTGDLHVMIENLSMFLTDPTHLYNIILWHLKEQFILIPQKNKIMNELVELAVRDLRSHFYVTPKEKHALLRFLGVALYLCDGEKEDEESVFKGKVIKINNVRDVLRRESIIPVFMDMQVIVPTMLQVCTNWDPSMVSAWSTTRRTSLRQMRGNIRSNFINFSCEFSGMVQELKGAEKARIPKEFEVASNCWNLIVRGMKLLGSWSAAVHESLSWKYSNPCSKDDFLKMGGRVGDTMPYQCATQYNYSNEEKWVLVEILGLIKGLAKLMIDAKTTVAPILAFCIHKELQDFLQFEIILPLRRANKKKKRELLEMLQLLRYISVDVPTDRAKLELDYTNVDRKRLPEYRKSVTIPRRCVFPTKTQTILLMRVMREIFDEDAPGMKGGYLAKKTLKKDELPFFESLYNRLCYADKVHDYVQYVREVSDMSCFWFREYYLAITRCIQFPIMMSLPWMLADFAMSTPSLAPSVFVPLSIYNDCAEMALRVFRCRFLYDEIEAEMSLVWQQLLFTLVRKIFDHYKNQAAQMLIDKPYARKYQANSGQDARLTYARYDSVIEQKHITLLGRNIDLQMHLTRLLNNYIRDNVEGIMERFEKQDVTMCMELESLLDTLKLTVEMIRKKLPAIDSFETILAEKTDNSTLGSYQSSLRHAILYELCTEICKKYVYNSTTKRFVRVQTSQKEARKITPDFKWGSRFTEMFEKQFEATKGFFGLNHVQSILRLLGHQSSAALLEDLTKYSISLVTRDFSPYVQNILSAVDPIDLKPATYGVVGIFVSFSLRLQSIKVYKGKQAMNDVLREVGNNICLIRMFDEALTHMGFFNYQVKAFVSGFKPPFQPLQAQENSPQQFSTAASMKFSLAKPLRFPDIIQSVSENIKDKQGATNEFLLSINSNACHREKFLTHNTGGWLFSGLLDRLYTELENTGLLQEWRGKEPEGKVLESENPKDFARFWSIALFCFLVPDTNPDLMVGRNNPIMSDQAYFGDGWTWAGLTIIHLLGLRSRFRLFDFTNYLHKIQTVAQEDLSTVVQKKKKKNKSAQDDPTLKDRPFVRELLKRWEDWDRLSTCIEATLKSHFDPPPLPTYKYVVEYDEPEEKV